jgi:hypothetical protein
MRRPDTHEMPVNGAGNVLVGFNDRDETTVVNEDGTKRNLGSHRLIVSARSDIEHVFDASSRHGSPDRLVDPQRAIIRWVDVALVHDLDRVRQCVIFDGPVHRSRHDKHIEDWRPAVRIGPNYSLFAVAWAAYELDCDARHTVHLSAS